MWRPHYPTPLHSCVTHALVHSSCTHHALIMHSCAHAHYIQTCSHAHYMYMRMHMCMHMHTTCACTCRPAARREPVRSGAICARAPRAADRSPPAAAAPAHIQLISSGVTGWYTAHIDTVHCATRQVMHRAMCGAACNTTCNALAGLRV